MSDPRFDDVWIHRLAEASAWRVALFDADLETSAEFETWLSSDAANTQAWRQVSGSWDSFSADTLEPELIIARRDALERARRHRQRRFAGGRWNDSRLRVAAALVAVVSLTALLAVGAWVKGGGDTYQTALGERRAIVLADGSHVDLDSNSLLKVRLGGRTRALELLRGQADFQVAHDISRPFTVRAGGKTVVATGTDFNVDLFDARVIVTLIEGRVAILQDRRDLLPLSERPSSGHLLARLTPGEQLDVSVRSATDQGAIVRSPAIQKVNSDRATAWETGELVFDDEPLALAAARVARYSDEPIEVDPSTAGLRLSGVFNTGDVSTFLDAIQRALPVTAETDADRVIRLRHNGA